MPKYGVTPKKEAELLARLQRNSVAESDLEEKFIRSGGPGGQHVNRSATCVYLKHIPSGLEVKMQQARSQALNRFYARRRLCEMLEAEAGGEDTPEQRRIEKLRRQKSRRKRRNKSKTEAESGDTPESSS